MSTGQPRIEASEAFAQLGRIVLGEQPLSDILERVVQLAAQVLPTSVEASITLIAGEAPVTVGFTSEAALSLDERQYESERGPCLDAAASGTRVSIPDMSADGRWPRFSAAATALGVRSSLSIPLPVQRQV